MNDIWKNDKTDTMIDTLHAVNSICEQWKFAITTLVEEWKQDIDNPWKDDRPMISAFEILQEHIDKVCTMDIRFVILLIKSKRLIVP